MTTIGKVKTLLRVLVSISLLAFVMNYIGLEKLYKTLREVNLSYMPFLLITLCIEFLLGATTLNILINQGDKKLGFFKTLKYFLRSFSLGLFVPAKLGEVSFIYFLNKEGIEVGKASAIFVLDKLVSLITLLLVGIVGIIILFNGEQRISVMVFLGISISVGLFFIMSNFGRGLVKRFILRKYSDLFAGFSKTLFYYLKEKTNVVILNFFLSIIRWTFGAMSVYIMFLSLNYDPKFFYVWIIKPLTIIISLIPITIAGLGVREGSAIFLFSIINIPPNITASVYFTFTAINYLLAGILIVYFLNKN